MGPGRRTVGPERLAGCEECAERVDVVRAEAYPL